MELILPLLLPLVGMFGVMYLFLIRPQNKREAARVNLVDSLVKGDRVRTIGGIVGNVTEIGEDTVFIRSGSNEIEVLKQSVSSKLEK